jgi:hypothetical protein
VQGNSSVASWAKQSPGLAIGIPLRCCHDRVRLTCLCTPGLNECESLRSRLMAIGPVSASFCSLDGRSQLARRSPAAPVNVPPQTLISAAARSTKANSSGVPASSMGRLWPHPDGQSPQKQKAGGQGDAPESWHARQLADAVAIPIRSGHPCTCRSANAASIRAYAALARRRPCGCTGPRRCLKTWRSPAGGAFRQGSLWNLAG